MVNVHQAPVKQHTEYLSRLQGSMAEVVLWEEAQRAKVALQHVVELVLLEERVR